MVNKNLDEAKKRKNDEFYTQYADIEREVLAYVEYDPDVFRGKTILLPCDDPEWSNFTLFFANRFEEFGLKKLISTSYAPDAKKIQNKQPSLFELESEQYDPAKSNCKGKIFVLDHDITGDGKVTFDDLQWQYLDGDGDFRSDEVKRLRDEADIIITNPPFSLFREFFGWLMEANKEFLIIGNINAITYKEIFPHFKANEVWLGNGFQGGNAYFGVEMHRDFSDGVYNEKTGLVKFRNCCWFTNIDHGRRHQPLQLMTMADNIKFKTDKSLIGLKEYRHYDNYDAIEVPATKCIPSDYDGAMGVPVTFLDKYCPEQFEIIGASESEGVGFSCGLWHSQSKISQPAVDGVRKYKRLLIRKKR